MAIKWGPAVYSGGNGFRVGYEFTQSPATLTSGTTSVTVTCKTYGQTQYYAWDTDVNWTISGQMSNSGSKAFNVTSSTPWSTANIFPLGSDTRTFAPSTTATTTTTVSGSLSGLVIFPGLTARFTDAVWTTGKRPLSAPAAPVMSGSTGAVRVSDTQHTISWTNTSPTSSTAPYQYIDVQRQTDGGTWTTIASPTTTTTYSDKTTSANHKYAWRVRARNGAGSSTYSGSSNTLSTTPKAPGTPVPTKGATSIALTWTGNPPWATGIQVWHAANGVWDGSPLTTLGGTATSYTHASPVTTVTHAYRLAATTTTPALTSAYSATSVTVALTAPPAAPTNVTPNGVAVDATGAITITWKHNPTDTTLQTARELQVSLNGAAYATVGGKVTTGTQSMTIAAGTYSNPGTLAFKVRTWGQATTGGSDGTGASVFSTPATVTLSAVPTVNITSPAPVRVVTDGVTTASSATVTSATAAFTAADVGSSITGGSIPAGTTITTINSATSVLLSANATSSATGVTLTITDIYQLASMSMSWAYFDAEGTAQAQAVATLYGPGLSVLERRTIIGAATDVTFDTTVANGGSYTVGVKVQDGAGLWSDEDTQAFTVVYSLPPEPSLVLAWDSSNESVSISITNPPTGVGEVDAVGAEVWRSIGGGEWIKIEALNGLSSAVVDYIPDLVQTNSYQVVAVSALPSRSTSATVSISPPSSVAMMVNAGPSFSQSVRLRYNPDSSRAPGRSKVLQQFAGRTDPIEYPGEQRSKVINIAAVVSDQLEDTATLDDIEWIADLPAPACYRDPTGQRVFVSMGTPQLSGTFAAIKRVAWDLTKISYSEAPASGVYVVGFGVFFDDDAVPYYDPTRRSLLALDADGVPYIVSGA